MPRPRPRLALASWLREAGDPHEVLLAPRRPGIDAVAAVDAALARRGSWARLPDAERLARAERLAVAVYDAVLSAHNPSWSTRIATTRLVGRLDEQDAVLAAVQEGVRTVGAAQAVAAEQGDRDRLTARMPLLPPVLRDEVLRAWDEDATRTWRLVYALTHASREPLDVVAEWQALPPSSWLDGAGPASCSPPPNWPGRTTSWSWARRSCWLRPGQARPAVIRWSRGWRCGTCPAGPSSRSRC
jgi:hypothetical protein